MSLTITTVTSYADIGAIENPIHGDFVVWRDLTLRYHSTIADWIPSKVWSRRPLYVSKISGGSASPSGWTVTTTGTGTVTSDGTKLTINGSAASGDTAYVTASAAVTNGAALQTTMKGGWLQGRFQVGAPRAGATNYGAYNYIAFEDGRLIRGVTLQVGISSQEVSFFNATAGTVVNPGTGAYLTGFDLQAAEAFVVVLFDGNMPHTDQTTVDIVYVNGYLQSKSMVTFSSVTTETRFLIGDTDTGANEGGSVICRNVVCGLYDRRFAPKNQIWTYMELEDMTGMADGDTVIWHDLALRYDATVEDWVPAQVYGVTSNVAYADGDNATPTGYSVTTTNSGTVTTDGTRLTISGPSSSDTAFLTNSHGQNSSKGAWVQGLFQITFGGASNYSEHCVVSFEDDAERRSFTLRVGNATSTFEENSGFTSGTASLPSTYGGYDHTVQSFDPPGANSTPFLEHHLVVIWSGLVAGTGQDRYDLAYVNGRLSTMYYGTGYAAGTGTKIDVGCVSASSAGGMKVRNLVTGTFTR